MNCEQIELIVNEVFDDCEVRENYKVDDCEVIGYCLNNEEYKFLCMKDYCIIIKKDYLYDMSVKNICKNENELKKYLNSIKSK